MFEYRPDLKGIKTQTGRFSALTRSFEYRPDLKGIKTEVGTSILHLTQGLNTALTGRD